MASTLKTLTPEASDIQTRSVTPTIGAELSNVDVVGADAEKIAALRALVMKHKVVFLRRQTMQPDDFVAFAEKFGPTTLHHPIVPASDNKVTDEASLKARANVWERDNTYRSDHWHTDVTFIERPVAFTMLRCIKAPTDAGDTLFANTVAAYECLPDPLKTLAESLRVVHSLANGMRKRMSYNSPDLYAWATEHPLVRVHSETGEKSLMVGSFAEHVVGMSTSTSWKLLEIFQEHILKPENLVRWTWQPGDLAIWDNRATQHYAVNDYGDAERVMQRLTVAGGIPVGVDGRPSRSIKGDASSFSVLGVA